MKIGNIETDDHTGEAIKEIVSLIDVAACGCGLGAPGFRYDEKELEATLLRYARVINGDKCRVANCPNTRYEGVFIGDLCQPCFDKISKRGYPDLRKIYSRLVDTLWDMKRGMSPTITPEQLSYNTAIQDVIDFIKSDNKCEGPDCEGCEDLNGPNCGKPTNPPV